MNKERKEALIRIPIAIISWIILEVWGVLTAILVIFNFLYVLFVGKRNREVANFVNNYISYMYQVLRYTCFTTNVRPFPFNDFPKMEKPEFKFQN